MSIFDNAVCLHLACSDRVGKAWFTISGSASLHHSTDSDFGSAIEVETIRIDDWVLQNTGIERVDFIRVDVEGREAEVLIGACETIRRYRPAVLFEFLDEFSNRSEKGNFSVFDFSHSAEYKIFRLDKSGHLRAAIDDYLTPDWTNDLSALAFESANSRVFSALINE